MTKASSPPFNVFFVLLSAAVTTLLFFEFGPKPEVSTFSASHFLPAVTPKPDLRLLLGILTVPDSHERRHLVRHSYALQAKDLAGTALRIDVRFVLCNLTNDEQSVLIGMEILLYDDIIVLDCAENMDDGKTYTYFSSVPRLFEEAPYDYVMKADDDTYFRLGNLAASLRALPREDVYYGFRTPCDGPPGVAAQAYMSGMGYMLSWDLVRWIASSSEVRRRRTGTEDMATGTWLREGGRGRNVFDMRPAMYDFPDGPPLCYRHALVAETIAIHKLKTNSKWAATLRFFNVTAGVKPSKLYHLY